MCSIEIELFKILLFCTVLYNYVYLQCIYGVINEMVLRLSTGALLIMFFFY